MSVSVCVCGVVRSDDDCNDDEQMELWSPNNILAN